MSFALLSVLVLGIVLLAGLVLTLVPERWQGQRWYTEPSSVFAFIALIAIVAALLVPHQ
ncbi:MAG: hypothetical protein KDK05_19200 [Candidatus Competibacteraceae bacterium]|nr:hypothetical protein [Candidatus Competibacteraceae bacterium]MCB1807647.1 hypothetical protein [Candidatus Competibacteraceae bacterium]